MHGKKYRNYSAIYAAAYSLYSLYSAVESAAVICAVVICIGILNTRNILYLN